MRFAVMLAAVAALFVGAGQARAVTWAISGTAPGIIHGITTCGSSQCTVETPYTEYFSFNVEESPVFTGMHVTLSNGIYSFFRGLTSGSGIYTGTFRAIGNGEFEGLTLHYSQGTGCTPLITTCYRDADTTNFSVRQTSPAPVPEPATWGLLLIGLGAVGVSMRQRQAWSLRSR